ncbi:MAG: hypothetical protein HOL04_00610 [Gammaproteobacteria bacterium]|jgi:uptake hydrogenase large subunit|nr:hypothetical protein [Gammaproteobacteria bacterium]MBT4606183.1 hypothetical protein [Thiotrichales bacterium]MBT3472715.1 hypothetical protein [Gammaproteobacteria bacterium]MBT3968012.1 hypothetical protein [Gammaproteobacteria bacterium]MBT4081006.1 hypothetical protein [Gammaproteobacteria bacterium]
MNLEGKIAIALSPSAEGGCAVSIHSSRPVHAARLFQGKTVTQTLQSLPLLFSVCGTAQAAAAVRGCEQALGIEAPPATERVRQQLVAMETIREHLWRTLLGWSTLLDQPPPEQELAQVMALQQQLRQALIGSNTPFLPQADTIHPPSITHIQQQLQQIIERTLLGIPLQQWLAFDKIDQLFEWGQQHRTVAAAFIQQLEQRGWSGIGRSTTPALPTLESRKIHTLMEQPEFVEQPLWEQTPHETTPLSRTQSPLLDAVRQRYGNALLTRSVGRLTELLQQIQQLPTPTPQPMLPSSESGIGIGISQAARGQLLHRVSVEEEQILRYQILAPTEWNFHPQGAVAEALQSLDPHSPSLQQQAQLIIHAIDPCVGYDLTIHPQ